MTITGFKPLPISTFGGWNTLQDPSDVVLGMSPDLLNVIFKPGWVGTRPGLTLKQTVGMSASIAALFRLGFVEIGSSTFGQKQSAVCLAMGGSHSSSGDFGDIFVIHSGSVVQALENPIFPIESSQILDLRLKVAAAFQRAYLCFNDGKTGIQPVRYLGVNTFYSGVQRAGREAPGEGAAFADGAAGSIVAGVHKGVVIFETVSGYRTAPSPVGQWTAAGAKKVDVTAIPTGPPDVLRRILAFTAAGGEEYYFNPNTTMVINDNTTTSVTGIDFTEIGLLAGENVDHLFRRIPLPEMAGVVLYNDKLVYWGARPRVEGFKNMTFDGGFSGNRPLGWTETSPGETKETTIVVTGHALRMVSNVTAEIRQVAPAVITTMSKGYGVRVRVQKIISGGAGKLYIGWVGTGVTSTPAEVVGGINNKFAVCHLALTYVGPGPRPADLAISIKASGGTAGNDFIIEDVEIYDYNPPQDLGSELLVSEEEDPEAVDGIDGRLTAAPYDGQSVRDCFVRGNFLYIVKERHTLVTFDDGVNPPARWTVVEVSDKVGTPSLLGTDGGDSWDVIASRDGLYLFAGGNFDKISDEIQPSWDRINWLYGFLVEVKVDTKNKRIYVAVPWDTSTIKNRVLVLDYREGFGDPIRSGGKGRKWAIWDMPADALELVDKNLDAQVNQDLGQLELWIGNSNNSSKVWRLDEAALSDEGAAIDSYYETAYLASASGERIEFGYLTANVIGAGTLALRLYRGNQGDPKDARGFMLDANGFRSQERKIDVVRERMAVRIGTNAVGAYFSLQNMVLWARGAPWSPVRGKN